ncbi:phage major capsid protein [Acuticoccus sp. M5D2P5]|uniref:phage major capsid protein n=1 Tax=Acuticoccus kalidii TaxID=2910977 RepID=UPI001F2DEE1E|nr:phage major capsid protein [Acuticoccus kalidii]MCF3934462.1 phage major capsid protein [Acuticoccus kalidii]
MDNEMGAPETKADLGRAFTDFMGAFEVFRETNDQRLAELEAKSSTDVLTDDKLARVEAALDANQRRMDELVLKSSRPSLGGEMPVRPSEQKSAFDGYMRAGDTSRLEAKALTATADTSGYNVPVEVEGEVLRRLALVSPIRSIATVRQVSGISFRKPVIAGGPAVGGWVSETAARPTTDADFATLDFHTMELYAMPAATAALLDDTAVNMDEWLADEIETVFAEQETKAFVAGSGSGQPTGITSYTTVADSSWEWGKIGRINTGVDGGFPVANPGDVLIDLVYALKSGYRQNAHFVMNRRTQAAVRKLKDGDGNYLWAPPSTAGMRASLLNFPVVEAEDMPDISGNAGGIDNNAIAFGDFRRGYLIVDRQGIRILRDPYSSKPYVLFYTTKRVGGGVQDFEAIKLLQFDV